MFCHPNPQMHLTQRRRTMKQEYITIISKRARKKIRTADILYIIKSEYLSLIHMLDGEIIQTITLTVLVSVIVTI